MTGCPSAPKCRWTTCLNNWRTPLSRSFMCLDTGYVMEITPHRCPVSVRTQLLWCGIIFPRLTSWKAAETLGIHLGPTAENSTSNSHVCSATMVSRTPPPPHDGNWKSLWGFVIIAVANAKLDAFNQCMADLLVMSLLFCLCSCEYTKTNSHRRTDQFRF